MDGAVELFWGLPIHSNYEPTAIPIEEYPYFMLETGDKYQRSILGAK